MFSKKLLDALERYENKLNDDFPTIPLAECHTESEVLAMIEECIKEKKTVEEMGYISSDCDIIY